MRKGLWALLLAATAFAGPEEEIERVFKESASLPGKLNFDAYSKVLAAKGYGKPQRDANDLRSEIASYLGPMLGAPCEVRRIRVAEDGASATAVVSLGGWMVRWFLVKDRDRWWYSDFEDVRRAMRFSDWDHLPDWLRDAMSTEEESDAVKLLLPAPEGKRAATVETARLARLAYCLWMLDREKEALRCCEEAATLSDAPVIHLWRAYAAFAADELEVAVTAANAYLDAVGEDATGCYELGRALYWLKRRPEAADAFLRGLKADPTDTENLLGLFRALPDDGKALAVEYFLKREPLSEWFAYLAARLARSEDWEAVEALLDAYRKGHADDPEVRKYEAIVLAGRGRNEEAAPLLLALVPGQKDPQSRAFLASLYFRSMQAMSRSLEGYARLPEEDRDRVWSYLASLLAYKEDQATLAALLEKRREKPDTALAIWEIELRWLRKEYAEAAALARKHGDTIRESDDREHWRVPDRQARSLLRLGKAAEALAPARERDDPILLFAVHVALGQNDEAAKILESALAKDYTLKDFEGDEDAGPALEGEAFAELRAKHAEKPK